MNGLVFLLGWVAALAVVSVVACALADQGNAATDSTTSASIAWGEIVFGILFLLLAARNWRKRPAPGEHPAMPTWMAGIAALKPGKALGLGLLLAGANPKNLMLAVAAGAGLAQLGLSTADVVVSLVVFVVLASLTIAGPVVYYLLGGAQAKAWLDKLKDWLAQHNDAVVAVLFLVFGAKLSPRPATAELAESATGWLSILAAGWSRRAKAVRSCRLELSSGVVVSPLHAGVSTVRRPTTVSELDRDVLPGVELRGLCRVPQRVLVRPQQLAGQRQRPHPAAELSQISQRVSDRG